MSWHHIKPKHGFRSGFESRVASELNASGQTFEYETEKIHYIKPEKKCTYNPDIIVRVNSEGKPKKKPLYIELKGRFQNEDRQKHILVRAQHKDLDIRFVFENPRAKIGKGSKTTYGMWCDRHKIKYAKMHVPQEWLDEE